MATRPKMIEHAYWNHAAWFAARRWSWRFQDSPTMAWILRVQFLKDSMMHGTILSNHWYAPFRTCRCILKFVIPALCLDTRWKQSVFESQGHVFLTNPDMLHFTILASHARWRHVWTTWKNPAVFCKDVTILPSLTISRMICSSECAEAFAHNTKPVSPI